VNFAIYKLIIHYVFHVKPQRGLESGVQPLFSPGTCLSLQIIQ